MKISVITAVFNAKDTVADAIDSILRQTHHDIELIVIDGASTDGTLEILKSYEHSFAAFVSEPDNGIYDALNKGIQLATGDVIGFLHADDLFADKEVLADIAAQFSDQSVDAIFGDLTYVNKAQPDKTIRYWKAGSFSFNKLKRGWMPPHPTLYVRHNIYKELGTFDTSFRIAADYDFMLRMLCRGDIKCIYISKVLVKMRVGGASNRSLKNILRKSSEDYRALRTNGIGGIVTLLWKNIRKIPQFIFHD